MQNVGQLPWQLGLENEVSLTISAYNLKIIREDRAGVSGCGQGRGEWVWPEQG